MTDPSVGAVEDDETNSRFVLDLDGTAAQLVYDRQPGRLVLIHTEVPDALTGRGIGGALVRAALEQAREDHLTVVPWCPFARRWLADHPDTINGVDIDWTPPPR